MTSVSASKNDANSPAVRSRITLTTVLHVHSKNTVSYLRDSVDVRIKITLREGRRFSLTRLLGTGV